MLVKCFQICYILLQIKMQISNFKFRKDTIYLSLIGFIIIITFYKILDCFFLANDDVNWIKFAILCKSEPLHLLGSSVGGYFRPVNAIFFVFLHTIFGLNPVGYYLVNLIFHFLNSILVYFITSKLAEIVDFKKKSELALVSALIFAVIFSPRESILHIACFQDLLSLFFYLLTIYLFIHFITNKKLIFYIFSLFAFILSLLSKEFAITLPLVILLQDFLFNKDRQRTGFFLRNLPYFLITFSYISYYKTQNFMGSYIQTNYFIGIHSIKLYLFYFSELFLSLFGYNRSPWIENNFFNYIYLDYKIPVIITRSIILASLILVSIYIFLKKSKSKEKNLSNRLFIFAILFSIFTFIPVSPMENILRDSPIPISRYLYFSSVGFSIFIAGCIFSLFFNFKKIVPKLCIIILVVGILFINILSYRGKIENYIKVGEGVKSLLIQMKNLHSDIPNNTTVYFINFPGIFKHLYWLGTSSLLSLYYDKEIKVVWVVGKDDLKNRFDENDIFIALKDGKLKDVTEIFKNRYFKGSF